MPYPVNNSLNSDNAVAALACPNDGEHYIDTWANGWVYRADYGVNPETTELPTGSMDCYVSIALSHLQQKIAQIEAEGNTVRSYTRPVWQHGVFSKWANGATLPVDTPPPGLSACSSAAWNAVETGYPYLLPYYLPNNTNGATLTSYLCVRGTPRTEFDDPPAEINPDGPGTPSNPCPTFVVAWAAGADITRGAPATRTAIITGSPPEPITVQFKLDGLSVPPVSGTRITDVDGLTVTFILDDDGVHQLEVVVTANCDDGTRRSTIQLQAEQEICFAEHARLESFVCSGRYKVLVENCTGEQWSNEVVIGGVPVQGSAPVITQHPQGASIWPTQSHTFTVASIGGTQYQWQKLVSGVWQNISGATTSTLNRANAAFVDAGQYRAVVSNQYGSVVSLPATLIVSCKAWVPQLQVDGGIHFGSESTVRITNPLPHVPDGSVTWELVTGDGTITPDVGDQYEASLVMDSTMASPGQEIGVVRATVAVPECGDREGEVSLILSSFPGPTPNLVVVVFTEGIWYIDAFIAGSAHPDSAMIIDSWVAQSPNAALYLEEPELSPVQPFGPGETIRIRMRLTPAGYNLLNNDVQNFEGHLSWRGEWSDPGYDGVVGGTSGGTVIARASSNVMGGPPPTNSYEVRWGRTTNVIPDADDIAAAASSASSSIAGDYLVPAGTTGEWVFIALQELSPNPRAGDGLTIQPGGFQAVLAGVDDGFDAAASGWSYKLVGGWRVFRMLNQTAGSYTIRIQV